MALTPDSLRNYVLCRESELNLYTGQMQEATNTVTTAVKDKAAVEEAMAFVLAVTQRIQKQVKAMLDTAVNHAAAVVHFDRTFTFEFSTSRDKTIVTPILSKNGKELGSMLGSDSGGLAEVLALAVRVSFIVLSQKRRFVFLDEDFTGIDRERLPITRALLKELSQKLNVQIVLNTHLSQLSDMGDSTITMKAVKEGEWEKCGIE